MSKSNQIAVTIKPENALEVFTNQAKQLDPILFAISKSEIPNISIRY